MGMCLSVELLHSFSLKDLFKTLGFIRFFSFSFSKESLMLTKAAFIFIKNTVK